MKTLILAMMIVITGCVAEAPAPLVFDNSAAENSVTQGLTYTQQLQVADRTYVESVLLTAFDIAKGTTLGNTVQTAVYQKAEFGGSCDTYEPGDNGTNNTEFPRERCLNGITTTTPPNSNAMRYSLTMKICDTLINNTTAFTAFMKKIYPPNGTAVEADAAAVAKAYGIFFVEETPSKRVSDALIELSKQSTDKKVGWQLITNTLCISPEWQVL